MKKAKLILFTICIMSVFGCFAQNSEMKNIKEVIMSFSEAGDKNDSKKLSTYLDDNYRVVMNRLFGSESVNIMNKATYLQKIESKEYGGDQRVLTIENILINGNTASAKVIFRGTKMTFVSILVLVQNQNGDWKLISDIPVVQ